MEHDQSEDIGVLDLPPFHLPVVSAEICLEHPYHNCRVIVSCEVIGVLSFLLGSEEVFGGRITGRNGGGSTGGSTGVIGEESSEGRIRARKGAETIVRSASGLACYEAHVNTSERCR